MSNSTLTLTGFAALMEPVTDFVTNVSWVNGEPVDVLLNEKALRFFGEQWRPEHPIWELFDALDTLGIDYGFTASEEATHG